MATRCYAIVRGSTVRATALSARGQVTDPVRSVSTRAVAKVTINEVLDQGADETLKNPEEERRIRLRRPTRTLRHTVDVDFLRVDPTLLNLIAGVPLVYNASGDIVGFDADTRVRTASFALEVWSKLDGARCAETGEREWGYTVFPYLRGGILTGFQFSNGLVSFNLLKAQTRRAPFWGVGPYDLTGIYQRLTSLVSRNTSFRMLALTAPPPPQTDGVVETDDVVSNGTPANPMPDPTAPLVLDGGTPADASPYIISGGRP